jgi:hypothetical protein
MEDSDLLDWRASIDWAGFRQGAVSAQMWSYFCDLVRVCHAHGHWREVEEEKRMAPERAPLHGPESKHYRSKRRQERKSDIERALGRVNRASYLADERIARMSHLLTNKDEGTPICNLYRALDIATRRRPLHTRARWDVVRAFKSFDADTELKGDPVEIARRWSRAAGYGD